MLGRLGRLRRRLRRALSRSEWVVRLLGLPKAEQTMPGLILIQIDGLSRPQLEAALAAGRMPFLHRLLREGDSRLHSLYSGIPSSTPAFQGELFYGVRQAVPAFSFREADSGRIVRMFDPEPAARLQSRLAEGGPALLAGGSAYSNILSGGAEESHVCAATVGFGELLRVANPFLLASLVVWHGTSVLRTIALLGIEAVLAVVDCVRGILAGRDLIRELIFVPGRVAVSILLREIVTIGAIMDVTRGLPVIHLNLLGYDEQAHRRGPSSAFAHWTLRGIDHTIRRIARAAHVGTGEYQLWVYSDHGQEKVTPYAKAHGRSIEKAVAEVFDEPEAAQTEAGEGVQYERAKWLGKGASQWVKGASREASQPLPGHPAVAAMGPLGHVYPAQPPTPEQTAALARALMTRARVPMVLTATAPGGAHATTEWGDFELPGQAVELFGPDHPFAVPAAADLVRLCHHPEAGTFVLSGWRRDGNHLTFPAQNGAHAGPGAEECHAFALLPAHTRIPGATGPHLTVASLRAAALAARGMAPERGDVHALPAKPGTVRVMTYNVHGCVGTDGRLSPGRIAQVIARYGVDVACLQELDVGRARSGHVDQAHAIAQRLEMTWHFHSTMTVLDEQYGNAVLSRFPLEQVRSGNLPPGPGGAGREPRGALWVRVLAPGGPFNLVTTHLGLSPRERRAQAVALTGPKWAGNPDFSGPSVLCGDLNALPGAPAHSQLSTHLSDAQRVLKDHRARRTWPSSPYPVGRIDHLFVNAEMEVVAVHVPHAGLTRVSSDHLPLIVDLRPR